MMKEKNEAKRKVKEEEGRVRGEVRAGGAG